VLVVDEVLVDVDELVLLDVEVVDEVDVELVDVDELVRLMYWCSVEVLELVELEVELGRRIQRGGRGDEVEVVVTVDVVVVVKCGTRCSRAG
jgi:hypothetical protein